MSKPSRLAAAFRASIVREIVAHATNELLVLGRGELWCCATQGRKALMQYFEVVMRWDVLKRTDGLWSSVMQKEVVCVAGELFRKE
jgi:hypothetical protein